MNRRKTYYHSNEEIESIVPGVLDVADEKIPTETITLDEYRALGGVPLRAVPEVRTPRGLIKGARQMRSATPHEGFPHPMDDYVDPPEGPQLDLTSILELE